MQDFIHFVPDVFVNNIYPILHIEQVLTPESQFLQLLIKQPTQRLAELFLKYPYGQSVKQELPYK